MTDDEAIAALTKAYEALCVVCRDVCGFACEKGTDCSIRRACGECRVWLDELKASNEDGADND